ncbi:Twitchin [Chionoecetes opilio]|uniref:Twitchin n=1 Tax=Chionoecetes opilio TaxID=41210 RepID=A0A8J5CZM3_CHIOP|nr:Twitchin [Chionoecetes opilio]
MGVKGKNVLGPISEILYRPSPPGQPEALDREGSVLSRLAYVKVENDALLLRWDAPVTDGGSPITGYLIERCEGEGSVWVRVNLVPIRDTEYAVANMTGGKEYRFRVTAENAVGSSDPSPSSEPVSISTDQEATEPHFLRELRDAVTVEGQQVEFSCDIIGTPRPDITWFKDGFEVYDTRRFGFVVEGDRYTLVLRAARLTDEGDIRVRATNRAGAASSQATFTVQAPPKINLPALYEQGLIFDTDELIRLRIPYTGRPQPQASWTHNGKQVEDGERHAVDVSEKHVTLKIGGASRTDKGLYTLKLSNPQGKDDASFFVTVTDRPDPPSAPTVTDLSGTALTLRWDPPREDGGCRISNYIVEYFRVGWDVWLKATSSRITWLQLTDLIVGSEYRFRIKAENAYGVSEAGGESQQVLIEEAQSTEGSFEYETIKAAAASGFSVPKEIVTLLQGESYSFDMSSSEESFDAGSFDAGEVPITSRTRFLSQGTSDEQAPSVAASEGERGQSFDIGSSVERGHSFEMGSSLERGASHDMQYSLDRSPSFDSEIKRNKSDALQWGVADESSHSESLGKEVSIEITDSDDLPVSAKYNLAASIEHSSSYEDERLLSAAEYLGGPAGGPLDLGSSAGEFMDLGSSFESMEPPKVPARSPRRGSPRSPSQQPSPFPGEAGGAPPRITLREEGEMAPTPPPRSQRLGSRASVGTDSSLTDDTPPYHVRGVEGGCELAPTPPPRSRRSGSKTSTASEISALELEGACELAPTPPPRSRRTGSSTSITSESSSLAPTPPPRSRRTGSSTSITSESSSLGDVEMVEAADSPMAPPRSRRAASRASQVSQASTVTSETQWEPEPFACATPPPSDVADIANAQAAPFSTPSSDDFDVPHNVCCGDQCARPLSATLAPHVCLCRAVVAERRGGCVSWCASSCRVMATPLLV